MTRLTKCFIQQPRLSTLSTVRETDLFRTWPPIPYLVNLEDRDKGGMQVILLRLFGVKNLDWMLPTLQVEDRSSIEILREQVHIHRSWHHNHLGTEGRGRWKHGDSLSVSLPSAKSRWGNLSHPLRELGPRFWSRRAKANTEEARCTYFERQLPQLLPPLLRGFHHAKEHVRVDSPLVGFIQNDTAVLPKQGVWNCFPQKHAVCQELDPGVFWGDIIEAHCIANLCREIIPSPNACSTPTR